MDATGEIVHGCKSVFEWSCRWCMDWHHRLSLEDTSFGLIRMPQGSGGKEGVTWSCLGEEIKDAILSRELDEARLDCKDDWLLLLARKIIMLDKTMHTGKVCGHFSSSKLEVINHFFYSPSGFSIVCQRTVWLVKCFLKQREADWCPYQGHASLLFCGGNRCW